LLLEGVAEVEADMADDSRGCCRGEYIEYSAKRPGGWLPTPATVDATVDAPIEARWEGWWKGCGWARTALLDDCVGRGLSRLDTPSASARASSLVLVVLTG
jgi:hypothetical protein